jgi:hypothetical protein
MIRIVILIVVRMSNTNDMVVFDVSNQGWMKHKTASWGPGIVVNGSEIDTKLLVSILFNITDGVVSPSK